MEVLGLSVINGEVDKLPSDTSNMASAEKVTFNKKLYDNIVLPNLENISYARLNH